MEFTLPDLGAGERWQVEIDTAAPLLGDVEDRSVKPGAPFPLEGRSVQVLRKVF
jgi:hypothetical protein